MTQPLDGCPGCGGEESFEQVHPGRHADDQCSDVGGECQEWVCPACGAGVFMGTVLMGPVFTDTVFAGPVFKDTVFKDPVFQDTVIIGTSAAGAAPARQSARAA